MTDREKYSWAKCLIIMWTPVIAVLTIYEIAGWKTPDDGSIGWYFVVTTGIWALTLAFRGVYLSGKRKGNQ